MASFICDNLQSPSSKEQYPLKLEHSFSAQKKKETLRVVTISLCIVSLIINIVLFVLGIVFATVRHSPATFAFAADCALDFLSSFVVLWRYFGSPYTLYSFTREKRACTSLGVLFVIAGICVIIEGVLFLVWKEAPSWFTILVALAGAGFCACTLLGAFKYVLYRNLKSKSIFLDALNSLLSGLFALVVIISDLVYVYNEDIWYLDPLLSIILSLGLIAYGFHVIVSTVRRTECQAPQA